MVWNGSWIGYPQMSRYISIIKAKTRKTRRKTKRHEENRTTRNGTGTHASHHGPWWSPRAAHGRVCPARSVRFFNAAFCALLVLQFGPRVLPMLGHCKPPLQVSLIHMALNFILSPITWLDSPKSAIKTQTSQNKCNWKNRGVNDINIHLNLLKWILNIQLILCKYDSYQTPPCLNFCLSSSNNTRHAQLGICI